MHERTSKFRLPEVAVAREDQGLTFPIASAPRFERFVHRRQRHKLVQRMHSTLQGQVRTYTAGSSCHITRTLVRARAHTHTHTHTHTHATHTHTHTHTRNLLCCLEMLTNTKRTSSTTHSNTHIYTHAHAHTFERFISTTYYLLPTTY